MIDMRTTVVPKSDQLNADDLIGQTRTIKVTKVSLLTEADQPIAIGFEGDNGKPYKPCKSMRRVMVHTWGPDGNAYIGRSMTIYRDDKVAFGGAAVGGIRISHMSHIDGPVTMALTVTRANRKPYTVKPLATPAPGNPSPRAQGDEAAGLGKSAFAKFWNGLSREHRDLVGGKAQRDAWLVIATKADEAPAPDDLDDLALDNDQTPPSQNADRRDEAAATGDPGMGTAVETGAGEDAPSEPAPDPQQDRPTGDGAANGTAATTNAAKEGAAPHSEPPKGAASAQSPQAGAAPTPSDEARKARMAEIKRDGQSRAEAGTAALADFLEGLRRSGEDGLVSSTLKTSWHEIAKAASAKAARK